VIWTVAVIVALATWGWFEMPFATRLRLSNLFWGALFVAAASAIIVSLLDGHDIQGATAAPQSSFY